MTHQESKRPLAFGKAYLLEPGPLIATRRYEHERAKDVARTGHPGIEQSGTLKRPLQQSGEQRESQPYKQIASYEPNGCSKGRALRRGVSPNTGVHENHWR